MIRRHDFNSDWWGKDVGIVSDRAFFELPNSAQLDSLGRFDWVEFVTAVSEIPSRCVLAKAGFFYVDTQMRFRLSLGSKELSDCGRRLEVKSAVESPFEVQPGDIQPFLHERFYELPGATESRIRERYSMWASRLVSQHPATALRFSLGGEAQGWFLAESRNNGLQLTLAMLSARSNISGFDLYSRAMAHFADLGYRLGLASFSVRNSNVFNIYSTLGARFVEPRECWMWVPVKHQLCDQRHKKM